MKNSLEEKDISALIDQRDEKIGRKIRDAEVKKIPFMLIVGEKEATEGQVSVRRHGQGDIGTLLLNEFLKVFQEEIQKDLAK